MRTGRTEDKGRRRSFLSCRPFRSFLPVFLLCSAVPTFICCHSYSVGGRGCALFFLRSDLICCLSCRSLHLLALRSGCRSSRAEPRSNSLVVVFFVYSPPPTPPSLRAAHGGSIYGVRPGLREPVLPDSSPNRSGLASPANAGLFFGADESRSHRELVRSRSSVVVVVGGERARLPPRDD